MLPKVILCFPFPNLINPFSANALLLYPLKTSENLQFSDVFREYRSGTSVENGGFIKMFSENNHQIKVTISFSF